MNLFGDPRASSLPVWI